MTQASEPDGKPFVLPVYTRRWGHADNYHVWLTKEGWYIGHLVHNGNCDPSGYPYLGYNFKQDYVDDPGVGADLTSLWIRAKAGLSPEEIQAELHVIANKIEASEREPRTRSGKKRRR